MVEPEKVRLQHEPPGNENTRESEDASKPLPPDSLDFNVEGYDVVGADGGFGQLWRKH